MRLQYLQDVLTGYGKNKLYLSRSIQSYFDNDIGPYMPSDALFFMLENGNLISK